MSSEYGAQTPTCPFPAWGVGHALDIRIKADNKAPAKARKECVAKTRRCPRDVSVTACLLVSELVTNTVRHGDCQPDDVVEVLIHQKSHHLHVEVCQRAAVGTLEIANDQEAREGGWGLVLVDELADKWGVGKDPNCVWFRLAA